MEHILAKTQLPILRHNYTEVLVWVQEPAFFDLILLKDTTRRRVGNLPSLARVEQQYRSDFSIPVHYGSVSRRNLEQMATHNIFGTTIGKGLFKPVV
jgi:hypothetical protein